MSWNIGAGLEGKGAIVTGAAGGIGREVAKAFARAGARVAAVPTYFGAQFDGAGFGGGGRTFSVGGRRLGVGLRVGEAVRRGLGR